MDNDSEKLFVLEFVVDAVEIQAPLDLKEYSNTDLMSGQTCVTFQFLHFPPVDICEQDFPLKQCYANSSPFFRSGKSCLFAISGKQLVNAPGEFVVNVSVARKLPLGISPDKVLLGQAKVDLTSDFITIIGDIVNEPQLLPVTQTFKDIFELMNSSGTSPVGTISIYVRFSYHGDLLVTEFEPKEDNTFIFKNCKNNVMYQCQTLEQEKSDEEWNYCNENHLGRTPFFQDDHDKTDIYQEVTRGLKSKRSNHEECGGDSNNSIPVNGVQNKRKKKRSSLLDNASESPSIITQPASEDIFSKPRDKIPKDDVVLDYNKTIEPNINDPEFCCKLFSPYFINVGNAFLTPNFSTGQANFTDVGGRVKGNDLSPTAQMTPFRRATQNSPQMESAPAGENPRRGRSKVTVKGKSQKSKGKSKGKKGHSKK